MKYFDYMLATNGTKKTLVVAPGFTRLKTGDLVRYPGSDGWETVMSSCTMSGDDDMLDMFKAAFGEAIRVDAKAKVSAVDFGEVDNG